MDKKRQLYLLGAFGIVSFFLYIHLLHQTLFIFGMAVFALYIALVTLWWRDIFHHVFRFERGFVSLILSLFAAIFFVSSIEAIVVALYTTTLLLTWISLTTSGLCTFVFRLFFLSRSHGSKIVGKSRKQYIEILPKTPWLSWIYGVLWIGTLILFIRAEGIEVLYSPWQSLSTWILPCMFVLTALLGFITFSKQKTKHILVLILMHSFLLHMYVPLSHELPWGGDAWRHIAAESQLAAGEIIPPVLFGSEAKWREVVGVDIPEVFLIPQKYAYGQFWSLSVILNQLTGVSFETIHIWMIPIIWSLIFPLILFRIGRILFRSWRGGLFLAWLSFIAFPLQALGALTLPVSLGVLTFFFTFMLWLQYIGKRYTLQRGVLAIFIFLMLFGYTLSFILMLFVVAGSWALARISAHVRSSHIGWSLVVLVAMLGIMALPALELLSGSSHFPSDMHMVEEGTQMIGQFSGWYYASDIRAHDIASGNLLFNHTPDYAFVSNIFTAWRWHVIPFMMVFFVGVLFGLYRYGREHQPLLFLLPVWLLVSLAGSYKIGWFFLQGDRLFTRRLDPFLTTLLLIFFSIAVLEMFYHIRYKKMTIKIIGVVFSVLIISWVGTSTFASGPDIRTASVDEYAVAEFILADVQEESDEYCVLADTWVLLPLEGVSGGDIVGGNFPIGYQFGQAERVAVLEAFQQDSVSSTTVQHMFDVVQRKKCIVVLSTDIVSEVQEQKISVIAKNTPVRYSGFLLWTFIVE